MTSMELQSSDGGMVGVNMEQVIKVDGDSAQIFELLQRNSDCDICDLISRKALLAAYDKAHQGPPGGARKLIEEAPVPFKRLSQILAAVTPQGLWEKKLLGEDMFPVGYECSLCGYSSVIRTNYCSNCGAKMCFRHKCVISEEELVD